MSREKISFRIKWNNLVISNFDTKKFKGLKNYLNDVDILVFN